MLRLAFALPLIAACGGGDSDPPPGTSGTVKGMVNDGSGAIPFDDDCMFFDSGNYVHMASSDDQTGVEAIWDPMIVKQPGTYTTSGIVPDITIAALIAGEIHAAEGMVVFTTLETAHIVGTLELTSPKITGTATFDCTR